MSKIKNYIEINGRRIGPEYPVYLIAELSANHNRNLDDAVKMIHEAKKAGADAVKLQTYTADSLTIPSDKKYFRIGGGTLWDGRTLYDLYDEIYTPWEWHPRLKKEAAKAGIDLFSSPFDDKAVDFLEKLGVPAHKIASFEIVDIRLIQKIARTRKPVIMSTGMASLGEIRDAVTAARKAGARQIALLKCTSAYPAPPEEMNLKTISHLAKTFKVPVGISDHTKGITVSIAAVAMGACLIERHFTLSRENKSADSEFSLEPHEFRQMADAVRLVEKAAGNAHYQVGKEEEKSRTFRRSLFIVQNMKAGELFTEENLRSIRPGYGLPPKYLPSILGRKCKRNVDRGTPLTWDMCR
ncbi:MAG: pseudaminic acid synthase [Candidatus Omnitrophica bacterium]|nr:pseudaminic acid synthase [Candidatus Omnitrophota bacterium]